MQFISQSQKFVENVRVLEERMDTYEPMGHVPKFNRIADKPKDRNVQLGHI